MPAPLARRLNAHPSKCGYSAAAIDARLNRPGVGLMSAHGVQNEIHALAFVARTAWLALAGEIDQPVLRVIRNLIASAPPGEVDAFALCLAANVDAVEFRDDRDALRRLSKVLDQRASWSVRLRRAVARDESVPNRSVSTHAALSNLRITVLGPEKTVESALKAGAFDDPGLLASIKRVSALQLEKSLAAALQDAKVRSLLVARATRQPRPRSLMLARRVVPKGDTRSVLGFLLTPPSGHAAYVAKTQWAGLSALIDVLGLDRMATVVAESYRARGRTVLRHLATAKYTDGSDLAIRLLEAAFPTRPAAVAATLFTLLETDQFKKSLESGQDYLALSLDPPTCAKLLRAHGQEDKALLLAGYLIEKAWRDPASLATYIATDPKTAKRSIAHILKLCGDRAAQNQRNELLIRLCGVAPELAPSLGAPLSLQDLGAILSTLGTTQVGNPLDSVLIGLAPGVFEAYLNSVAAPRTPAHPAFVEATCRLGGGPLTQAIQRLPGTFVRPALAAQPLRSLLPLAFSSTAIAREIERNVPRARLRADIEWVRQLCADRPRIAAAYELALAGSLVDARYLAWLSHKSRRPSAGAPRGHAFDSLYHVYTLPKHAGGHRTITAPAPRLKRLQRRLMGSLFATIPVHDAATGFRAGQSVVTNATPHVGQRLVVNVDIASFFDTTRYELIVGACRQVAGGILSPRAYLLLADLCAYNGHLPTGAPTSPALANIILRPVDRPLAIAASRHNIAYSRYADDLTFSGGDNVPRILPFVERLLAELGYRLDADKTNLFRRGRRQIVTGLVVNEKPNLPRRVRRRLRAAVHLRARGGTPHWHGREMSDAVLTGRLAQLNTVQPEEFRALRASLERATPKGTNGTGGKGAS